ncbi:MAG: phosphate ABC transporter substrate-binding protein [Armatimonadia bacterium]
MSRHTVAIGVLIVLLASALVMGGCSRPAQQTTPQPGQPMAGPTATPAAGGETIRQTGSTTLLPLAQKWLEGFNKLHPEVNIAVSGGGSGTGIKALISKTTEIADSSREIKDKEVEEAKAAGVTPVEHLVAHDGIAIIVHKDNPLTQISLQQLSDLYTGTAKTWDEVGAKGLGKVQLINRDSSSGTYDAFKEMVVQLHGKAKDRDFAAGTLNQTSNQGILSMVGQTKTAIGYVGLGYVDDTVKVLKVVGEDGQAVAPSIETVQSKKYPVARALYCYTNGEPSGMVKEYLDWIKGPEGQAIVKELGFVPVKAETK